MTASETIYIVDPDEAQTALVRAISQDMRARCESFVQAEDFLDAYQGNRPGCLVAEIRLPGMNGIQLQASLAAGCASLPVIFVTAHAETRMTVRAMQNGAVTVLEKPPSQQELWDAIRKALMLDSEVWRIDEKHTAVRRRLDKLTQKERQVLELMIQGKANKVIASRLDISVRTVEARRHQIFKKSKTDSIAELVRVIMLSEASDRPLRP